MENQYLSTRHPLIQLLFFALVTLITMLSVMLLSVIAGMLIFRIPVSDWINLMDYSNPAYVPVLKFLQITQSLALFVIPPVVFGWFMVRNPWHYLSLNRRPDRRLVLVVIVLSVIILPVLNLLAILNLEMKLPGFLAGIEDWMQRTEERAGELTQAFLTVETFPGYLVNLLMIALIPAFGEEFFFRGVLQKVFHQWFRNPHVAIIFVALLFSALHMQFYGFLPRFALGVLFGYVFWWSGNIWYPVLAHFLNNFLPVTLVYFFPGRFDPAELDSIGTGPDAWIWAIPSLILSFVAIRYFYRTTKILARNQPDICD